MIQFVKDTSGLFAIEQNVVYKGRMHNELLYCELTPIGPCAYKIFWEDDYKNPEFSESLEEAKKHVLATYKNHKPFSNGQSFEIEED